MERRPVKSSNIQSVGYDPATREMHIEFSGGKVYAYDGVTPEHHQQLIHSASVGSHFSKYIRSTYEGRKL